MDITQEFSLNTPCTILKTLSAEEQNAVVNHVIAYYRDVGFPYYSLSDADVHKILDKLYKFDVGTLELPDFALQQNMLGLNLANMYHPKMWEVRCGNSKTPMEVFLDDALFRTALLKRIKYSDTKLQPFNIRKSLKVFGAQSVSNFRPTIAKWVYQNYGNRGRVLDPCMGYGGRLLGACSSSIREYIGVDPDINQCDGNTRMHESITKYGLRTPDVVLINSPFEDLQLEHGYFDLVFTSPPYFDKEKYSYDDSQSWVRYPTMERWVTEFLYVLVDNSLSYTKPGGYLVINVSDKLAEYLYSHLGYPKYVWHMRLSNVIGRKKTKSETHKTEKILVWRK